MYSGLHPKLSANWPVKVRDTAWKIKLTVMVKLTKVFETCKSFAMSLRAGK